jgi:hypothetical protein
VQAARNIYLAVMCIAGVLIGAVSLGYPDLGKGYVTPLMILLLISLLTDIVLMRLLRDRVVPLSMEARFAGFFSGYVLFLLITFLFGAGGATA